MKDIARVLFAEFIGTFFLVLGVLAGLRVEGFLAPVIMATLIVGLMVYLLGPISGAHFNPAVSIGLWSVGKIDSFTAAAYTAIQVVSGLLAFGVISWLVPESHSLNAVDTLPVVVGELVGTFVLTFGIAAVAFGKVKSNLNGIIVGTSLFVGANLASVVSNGIINPAVALAVNSVSLSYLLAPVAGAILGFKTFKWLHSQ